MLFKGLRLFVVLGLVAGCGTKGGDNQGTTPVAQSPAGTYDPALASEYASLPRTVLIGLRKDGSGRPIPGTAEMRAVGGTAVVTTPAQAVQAFDTGTPVRVAAADELDSDSSAQSWSAYNTASNYAAFQPAAYSAVRQGVAFNYAPAQSYTTSDRIIYAYQRPPCTLVYCAPNAQPAAPVSPPAAAGGDLDGQLAAAFASHGVTPMVDADFLKGSPEQIDLGARLFADPILSANGDVACASCHVDRLGTSGALSLGPIGPVLGGRKRTGLTGDDLLNRNAPALFNLGHKSFTALFWDGRVAVDPTQPSGFATPAGAELPPGLNSALAAQALFPLVAAREMGCGLVTGTGEVTDGDPAVQWQQMMARVLAKPEYQAMLQAAFPEAQGHFTAANIGNAIAFFEASRWRADGSPFDRYLRGDLTALTPAQKLGASYFYGKAGCAGCHSGPLLTDQNFHAVAVPQVGPGAGDGVSGREDYGRARVTGQASDRYAFRTPSLRNVAATGPWGHDGAYSSLRAFVMHYADPTRAVQGFDPTTIILPPNYRLDAAVVGAAADPAAQTALLTANVVHSVQVSGTEADAIVEFLMALSDPRVARNDQERVLP